MLIYSIEEVKKKDGNQKDYHLFKRQRQGAMK